MTATALLLAGCGGGQGVAPKVLAAEGRSSSEPDATAAGSCPGETADLVSDQYPLGLAGDEGWDYHQHRSGDLDGDGEEETAHVVASVPKNDAGEYAWDDTHAWHVYVEEADGRRTSIFSGSVHLGMLDVFVHRVEGRSLVYIHENGGSYFALDCGEYHGPGKIRTTRVADHSRAGQIS